LTILIEFHSLSNQAQSLDNRISEGLEGNPVQDLFENYVRDLIKLRDEFHDELTATAAELSKAMDEYSRRGEAALTSFVEKVSACGEALEAAAATRLDQFRGLPATRGLPHVNDGPLATTADQVKVAATAKRAVPDSFESDGDHTPRPAIALVRSEPAA
jgi:hypothetical protein